MESKNLKKCGSYTRAAAIFLVKFFFKIFGRGYYTRAALIRVRKLIQQIWYMYNVHGCVQVCAGGAQVCVGVHRCPWVYTGLHWFVWVYAVAGVCMGACVYVWDEFSEYLLET